MINWVSSFMNSKGYLINVFTREFFGVSRNTFFQELHEEGFNTLFGLAGLNILKVLISDEDVYALPMWKPDIKYIKFTDAYWNLETGKKLSIANGDKQGIVPVKEYDIPVSGKTPTLFVDMIKRHIIM